MDPMFLTRSLTVDRLVDFSTMNAHIFWSFDPESYLITTNLDHRDRDVVVDDDTLVLLSGENQHRRSPQSQASLARPVSHGRYIFEVV